MKPDTITVAVNEAESVTALVYRAASKERAGVTVVLGHGAGADQTHHFMVAFAEGLASRGIDTVTFNFLYTEQRRKVPDRGNKLEACYRAVIDAVVNDHRQSGNKLFIGGKSMGGRIASQIAADGVEGLRGLIFLGYPLHPPGKPDQLRSKHLPLIKLPMLFIQGSRDPFGTPEELAPVIHGLKPKPEVYEIKEGDHSFKVPKRTGLSLEEVYQLVVDTIAAWMIE